MSDPMDVPHTVVDFFPGLARDDIETVVYAMSKEVARLIAMRRLLERALPDVRIMKDVISKFNLAVDGVFDIGVFLDEISDPVEVSSSFPEGNKVPSVERMTLRQFDYLRSLAAPISAHPSRRCEALTQNGGRCQNRSLSFSERAVCGRHCTDEEAEMNSALQRERIDSQAERARHFTTLVREAMSGG